MVPACGQRCQHDKGNNTNTKGDNASVMLVKTRDDVVSQVASPVQATLQRRVPPTQRAPLPSTAALLEKAKSTKDGDFTKEVDYAKDCGQFCGEL